MNMKTPILTNQRVLLPQRAFSWTPYCPRSISLQRSHSARDPTVVTIGEALYGMVLFLLISDLLFLSLSYVWGDIVDCLADQLGKPMEEVTSWTPYPGGAPANVAAATSRLGDYTAFISAIGKDELGDSFVALLKGMLCSGLS